MKTGKWTPEEDQILRDYIKEHGIGRSWQALANNTGLERCDRSCRSRWLNYLRPGLKHGNFTEEEDRIICSMYNNKGSCWSVIAAQLPGRTDLAVKNHWNCKLQRKKLLPKNSRSFNSNIKPTTSQSLTSQVPHFQITPSLVRNALESIQETELAFKIELPSIHEELGSSQIFAKQVSELTSTLSTQESKKKVSGPTSSTLMENGQVPRFDELVNWCIMSPSHELGVDFPSFPSSVIDMDDITSYLS